MEQNSFKIDDEKHVESEVEMEEYDGSVDLNQ